MTNTYRVEGIHYTSLSDLLSDGWAEDKPVTVEIWEGSQYIGNGTTTISRLRAGNATTLRTAARANEGYAQRTATGSVQYALALVTENEPGWVAKGWYSDLADAKDAADSYNRQVGITSDEALEIEISSMRAGLTR